MHRLLRSRRFLRAAARNQIHTHREPDSIARLCATSSVNLRYGQERGKVRGSLSKLEDRPVLFHRHTAKASSGIGGNRMADSGQHRYICGTIRESAGLGEVDVFFSRILSDASRLFVFSQQRGKDATGSDVISKLEAVTNDFIDAEVQGDGPHLKIKRPRDEYVAVAKLTRDLNQRFGLGKNRRFECDLEEIVGKTDEPVAMYPAVSPK